MWTGHNKQTSPIMVVETLRGDDGTVRRVIRHQAGD